MLFRINKSKGAFFTKAFKLIIYCISDNSKSAPRTPTTWPLSIIGTDIVTHGLSEPSGTYTSEI